MNKDRWDPDCDVNFGDDDADDADSHPGIGNTHQFDAAKRLLATIRQQVDGAPALSAADALLLANATTALARLDERWRLAPASIQRGAAARFALLEAAAEARLGGDAVDAEDLLLADRGMPCPHVDPAGLALALHSLLMLRAAARRDPRSLWTPGRLTGFLRLRERQARYLGLFQAPERRRGSRTAKRGAPDQPDRDSRLAAIQRRFRSAGERLDLLGAVLGPAHLERLAATAPLLGAADLQVTWHGEGAAEALSSGAGRLLAGLWLRRTGAVNLPVVPMAAGFYADIHAYAPLPGPEWPRAWLRAVERGATAWHGLIGRLEAAERLALEWTPARRRNSRLPAVVDLLVREPALTADQVAKRIGMAPFNARQALERLMLACGVVRELTGRDSFRLFALSGVL